MIEWESREPQILWNPRMPAAERARQEKLFSDAPRLERHFWVGTSGSSGLSKWVALSQDAVLSAAEGANRHLESDSSDVWLKAIPSFHVGGLGILARARLSGARVVECGEAKWDARVFHASADQNGVTLSALVPAQVYDLVQAGLRAPERLRAIVIGGGALEPSLYLEARKLGWNLLPSYGLTECCSQVATAAPASLAGDSFPELTLLPHVEARVREGKIEIRGAALLSGYALEREGGMDFVDPKRDGWFLTEDHGEIQGRSLVPKGRDGSFVKMGGESVDFARLEKLFEEARLETRFPGEAVLIAAPDERMGHLTHLVVVRGALESNGAAGLSRLRDSFDRRVLPVERIRKVVEVEDIPRSPLGKVLKPELLRRLEAETVSS